MKKILCLVLSLVMVCTMLVACSDPVIGDGTKDYPQNAETAERLDLNMYIITGDATTDSAKQAVATRIAGHTKITYNTELNVIYVSESEYESVVKNAINNGGDATPHIILINSESLFVDLLNENKLANLTEYYSSREFGKINTQINSELLECSKIDGKLYTVPNNRVLGEYEYLVINKEMALQTLKYGNAELSSYRSLEDAAELINEINGNGLNASDYVKIVKGPYELREELSKENFCNIVSNPAITSADAFASAFAIVNNAEAKYNERAMKLIYAINTDIELRNFLQYGVLGANYDNNNGDIVRINDGVNTYDMNLIYTGDVFKAYNCSALGWTDSAKNYGAQQNKDVKAN